MWIFLSIVIFLFVFVLVWLFLTPSKKPSDNKEILDELRYSSMRLKDNNEIYEKFHRGLMEILAEENIKYKRYDNIYELNEIENVALLRSDKKGGLACGIYQYIPTHTLMGESKFNEKYPKIGILANPNFDSETFVLAHELGHHFSIKIWKDKSELAADNYILILANKILTDEEIYKIGIAIPIYSKVPQNEFDEMYNPKEIKFSS